jgi:PKD repeat protein
MASALLCVAFAAAFAGTAQAYLVRAHGHVFGVLLRPSSRVGLRAGIAAGQNVSYKGGPVMAQNRLHLIFWGPPGSFAPSYQNPIVQWAQGLAADSGKTTDEFSIGSLFYESKPRHYISRTVTYGGGVMDTRPYPPNGCENPVKPRGVCLSDGELQAEIVRVVRIERWSTDEPYVPKNQYLLFTPRGVDSCQDQTQTSCTFSSKIQYCAYHSSFMVQRRAVVYSNLPYEPGCDSDQAPTGVDGNADTDGTLDSAIHEVLESATDPNSTRYYNPAWTTSQGYEIGDECDYPPQPNPTSAVYGAPLGGVLANDTAFNQLIDGHTYYTQQIWALATAQHPTQGCAQRIGPTPQFNLPSSAHSAGQPVALDASSSYDLLRPIARYSWNFGDGSPVASSPTAHASHTYAQPGTYQVSLTVSDSSGPSDASTQTQAVVIH